MLKMKSNNRKLQESMVFYSIVYFIWMLQHKENKVFHGSACKIWSKTSISLPVVSAKAYHSNFFGKTVRRNVEQQGAGLMTFPITSMFQMFWFLFSQTVTQRAVHTSPHVFHLEAALTVSLFGSCYQERTFIHRLRQTGR